MIDGTYNFSLKQNDANIEEWHKKELAFQGIQEFSSYIKNEMQIDNKSILDGFTSHITIAGATFLTNVGQQRFYFPGC